MKSSLFLHYTILSKNVNFFDKLFDEIHKNGILIQKTLDKWKNLLLYKDKLNMLANLSKGRGAKLKGLRVVSVYGSQLRLYIGIR